MPTQTLGKVKLTPRGAYDPAATYVPLDIVSYGGGSYCVLKNVTGVTPTGDDVNYQLLAESGADGKSPQISASKTWLVWDAEAGEYVDTGVSAAGEIPEVDDTLTQPGQAADAAAVGDRLSALSEEISNLGGGDDSVEPAEDDIPKVFFGGALQQTKDAAVVPFRYISKTQDIPGYAEIKAQGNSSMSYPKKNQTVKLFRDADCTEKLKVDFKGWGAQNKHVYKANWIDLSHARNVVSARLWADVVKSRAGYENLPELLRTSPNQGAVDGFPVKVYAAGVYQGRYTLNIPKDKWMVNMDDALDTHCILCGENYVSGCFRAAASINGSDWTDEIHDTVPDSILTRWNEVISFVMNSTDEEFKANLSNYFYVDSLIDYHLFGLVSCGLDAYGKNQIYATYDGQKWIASMYDMDSTWGLWWTGASFVTTDYDRSEYQDFKDGEGNLLYIRLEQLFHSELQTRWAELRNGALSIENIINRFERFTDIAPAELVAEDYASTTGGGKFTGIPSKTTNNIQQLRSFALARWTWVDEYVGALVPVPCTGISLNADTLTFNAEGTQTLTATVTPDGCTDAITWESDNNSVAIVDDGVVTAIDNGSAIITARCGVYSASCSVTVSGIVVDPNTPKHPLESGSFKDNLSGLTVTVSNGNHVELSAEWPQVTYPCITNIGSVKDFGNTTYTDPLFEVPNGASVRMVISNLTTTDESGEFSIWLTDASNTEHKVITTNTNFTAGGAEGTVTFDTGFSVTAIKMWENSLQGTIEFDIELYVNDVRYI